jgi:peptidoglycan biosynthesis protein MviN/MurJ (putative lipid II flippase)
VALGILAKPLTVALFQYGKFSAFDAAMTQRALVAYSVGLMGLIVVKVLAPGFYSRQDIKTPVKIAIVTLIMTQVMNLAFIGPLKHAGLSLSIGLAACLNAALFTGSCVNRKFTPQPGWLAFLLRLVVAVLVMSAALLGMMYHAGVVAGAMPFRLLRLMAVVAVGVVAYFATLMALGFRVKSLPDVRPDARRRIDEPVPHGGAGFLWTARATDARRALLQTNRQRDGAGDHGQNNDAVPAGQTYSRLPRTEPSAIPINTR